MSDGAALTDISDAAQAAAIVDSFLRVRPGGGRVFVDDAGVATTLVGGDLLYLGLIRGGAATVVPSAEGSLREAILSVLQAAPGSTAREVAYQLGRQGRRVSKTEVNALLYRDGKTFANDGASTPRWRTQNTAQGSAAGAETVPAVTRPSTRRHAVSDAYRELVDTSLPTPARLTARREDVEAWPLPDLVLDLMPWQREAMARWYDSGCHGIVEAVTGTGKTHLGLEAVAQARRDGQRSTILVPSVDLQDQWVDRFARFLPDVSIARLGGPASGRPESADVTIAVVNSALKRDLSALSSESLLVADEVHRYGAEQFQYALRATYRRRLGLTATLERSGDDAVEDVLSPYFGGSIMQVTFDRAIREQVVAPFRLIFAPVPLSDKEQQEYDALSRQISNGLKVLRGTGALKGAGGSVVRELGRLRGAGGEIGRAARTAETGMRKRRQLLASVEGKLDAIEELAETILVSQGSVVFTQTKEVAEEAALRLREWDVPASALHSGMADRERRDCLAGLCDGSLQALIAPKLLDEGIDVPTVDLGIVMTASRSRRQMVQRLGRVIRKKDDGRPVDFVIIYARDTVEDPESGVHEGFFDLVGDVAANKVTLPLGWSASDL